jgi:hypothetical protein
VRTKYLEELACPANPASPDSSMKKYCVMVLPWISS